MYCINYVSYDYIITLPAAHLSISFFIKTANMIEFVNKGILFAFYIRVFDLIYCKHKYFYRNKMLCHIGCTSDYVLRVTTRKGKRSRDFRD